SPFLLIPRSLLRGSSLLFPLLLKGTRQSSGLSTVKGYLTESYARDMLLKIEDCLVKINVLPDSLVSRIAAGEVVERPASVIKELVENALDAQAKEISVWVEKSGTSLIRVSDDGEGIAPEELPLALERHATSKLREDSDLFRISTLGFRGEALPSIGSVSKMEIVSRPRSQKTGSRVRVEGGRKGEKLAAGCSVGTTVEVRDLFYNTPARRKFLKSPPTELSHICDVINRMALACGEVHFSLHHAGRMLCDYPGTSRLQDRLQQVLGPMVANGMAPISWGNGGLRINGFLSLAPASFSNSRHLMIYVNRRFVRDRILTHAVLQGYETLLMKGRYPAAVVYLEIPFEEVDVNVHPAKYEVRFRHQSEVHDGVVESVREQLKREAKGPVTMNIQDRGKMFLGVNEPSLSYPTPPSDVTLPNLQLHLTEEEKRKKGTGEGFFSSLEIIGQILGCYLVCASPDGMVLIDQHAAHERVAFEKMRRQLHDGEVERQKLLIPQILDLSVAETVLMDQVLSILEPLGFTVEKFGPKSFAIKAAPAILPPGDYREAMQRMVAELAEIGKSTELREGLEERLATIACHSVIRANRMLEREEIKALLYELDDIDFATQCPHGRPVLLQFSREQLERMFKRT
ncbi:MAG: DNA mismatch repair endonuclease MutL, partial [Candidatus Binatia bacterium]